MNNAINMLPCPMCGCSNINVKNEQPTDNSGGYFIECPDCGISTSLRYACGDDPIPLLAEQWNRRATAQCLHQIAEPATAGTAVRAFRDYLGVHDGIKLGGHAMDDMALDLARIALNFPEALKGVRSEKPEPAPPQAVQPAVPVAYLHYASKKPELRRVDFEPQATLQERGSGWVTVKLAAPAHPAEGAPAQDMVSVKKQDANDFCRILTVLGMEEEGDPVAEVQRLLAATQPAADAVASIYVTAGGEREFDDWKVPLSVGRNLLYTQPAAQGMDAKGMLSDADYDDLWRFEGMASDGEGYDISKERMKRLAELGVIRWCGGSRYAVTSFGLYVLKAWQRLPLETYAESYARCNAEFKARIERLNAEALAAQAKQGVLTMAKNSKPVDAQGWCRPNPDGPEHYFTDAYPACGWKLPVKTNESGRCIECERAAQAAKQGEPHGQ